jgi:hypothetical protein
MLCHLIVMIPGSGSSGDKIYVNGLGPIVHVLGGDQYFGKLQKDFTAKGHQAIVCPKQPDNDARTIEERAEDCVTQILQAKGACGPGTARDVNLFGHSMGGLIARELAQDPRVEGCIQSVTTISTPHQGTPIADWAVDHATKPDGSIDIGNLIVNIIHFVPKDLHYLPELKATRTGADPSLFRAQDMPDNPAVLYYSITTSEKFIPIPPLEASRLIINDELKKRGLDQTQYGLQNDGIVPEYSMVHGLCLGHIDSHHFGAACVDPVKWTPECHRVSEFLVNHFSQIDHQ